MDQPIPSPAPGEACSVALAFVNTRYLRQGAEIDLLSTARDAQRWLVSRQLLAQSQHVSRHELDDLRMLRTAVRELFESRIAERPPRPASVNIVNRLLAQAPVTPRLFWPRQRQPQVVWEAAGPRPAAQAAAVVALDAVEALTDARADMLAHCDAHGCVRLFAREHARRRWCSTRCGARVRAARHQARGLAA